MEYDIIFITPEYFDHPLCGVAILKRVLEKQGYKIGVIEPRREEDVASLGKPRLFFGVTSGSIDSMLRNFNALNRSREEDPNIDYIKTIPDRAVIAYCNWIKKYIKDTKIVIGGTEATLRRFTHYDYWSNDLRKSIIFDTRADILVYGNGEKQILEIASRIKKHKELTGIEGTCIKTRVLPKEKDFILLPSHEEASSSKEKFCDMQLLFSNYSNLAQKTGDFYILQYKFPKYTSKDLDEYYEFPYARQVTKELRGFEFSVVTHRGCIGNCNFCSLRLTSGDKIISRSQESILKEIKYITTLPHFKGNIDDLSAPSANMYGMDCDLYYTCNKSCIDCNKLDKSNKKLIELLQKARQIKGIKKIFIRSGIRYDLVTDDYLKELKHHISGTLKIAPEHTNPYILELMNKNKGDLKEFIDRFNKLGCGELSFYFMTAHPGSGIKETEELAKAIKKIRNKEQIQIFTPTPMTMSTCMYYTGLNPITKKPIYVPYTFAEKKEQKRILMR